MNTTISSRELANSVFVIYCALLAILWMIFNYGGKGADPYTGSGIRWVLITVPLLTFIAICFGLLVIRMKVRKNYAIYFLLFYLISTLLTSAIHVDIKHFSEIVRWAIPLIFITHFRVRIPLAVINSLYLIAILVVVLTYSSGGSDYGYLPGQTTVNLHQGLWWRVSIWKYITPPYSAAFSIIVFLANYFMNKGSSRYIFYALTLYFIVLSGNRTGYLVLLYALSIIYVSRIFKFNFNKLYSWIPILAVSFVFLLQLGADLIPLLGIQNEFFNSTILRNESSGGDASNLSSRLLIMGEHARLASESDLFWGAGIGSEIYSSPNWTSNGGFLGGTSDSYISHLAVRDGASFLFLVMSFAFFFYEAMKERNLLGYVVLSALLLYTIGYGAWMNFSSPVFLMFLGFLYQNADNGKFKAKRRKLRV